jgi:hypothetical protein
LILEAILRYTKKVQNMTCVLAQHIIGAVTAKHGGSINRFARVMTPT